MLTKHTNNITIINVNNDVNIYNIYISQHTTYQTTAEKKPLATNYFIPYRAAYKRNDPFIFFFFFGSSITHDKV